MYSAPSAVRTATVFAARSMACTVPETAWTSSAAQRETDSRLNRKSSFIKLLCFLHSILALWPRRRFLTRLLEQKIERFLRADVPGDARNSAVFLQLRPRDGDGLPLLARDALHFPVDLFLGGVDRLALGDLVEQQQRLDVARRFIFLRFANFIPVELDAFRIDALRGERAQLIIDVDLDLPVDIGVRQRKIVLLDEFVEQGFLGFLLRPLLAFAQNRGAHRRFELFQRLIIAQVLGEFVV